MKRRKVERAGGKGGGGCDSRRQVVLVDLFIHHLRTVLLKMYLDPIDS